MKLRGLSRVFVVGLLLSALAVTWANLNNEANASGHLPTWASDLPIAVMQDDLSPEQSQMADWRSAAELCMANAGLVYDASAVDYSIRVDENRYGITRLPFSNDHLMDSDGSTGLSPDEAQQWYETLVGVAELEIALSDGSILYIPTGGCVEEADNLAFGDRQEYFTAVHETQIALSEALGRAAESPEIQKLMRDWSKCMATRGFDTPDLEEAAGLSVSDPTVVTAHIECDDSLNYTETWVVAEAEAQRVVLGERPELVEVVNRATG